MKASLKTQTVLVGEYVCTLATLVDKVMHPRKYDCFINVPGQFAAAEYLMQNHWADIGVKAKERIIDVLVHSGQYLAA
jgi:hypothetical protein